MFLTQRDLDTKLFNQLTQDFGIGIQKEAPRYPLTNISLDKNDNLYIEIAMAGFNKDWLQVEMIEGFGLEITGTWPEEKDGQFEYFQKHISEKSFQRKIKLDESYLTGAIDVDYTDGLLLIIIAKTSPKVEEKKRNFIPIG